MLMHLHNDEMQFGLRNDYADQAGLAGISVDANDFIIEIVLRYFGQDSAFEKKLGATYPFYFLGGNAGLTDRIAIFKAVGGVQIYLTDGGVFIYNETFLINNMYSDVLHIFFIARAASGILLVNGNSVRTTAKVAHNLSITRLRLFAALVVGGIATPSIGCIARMYYGDLSGLTDAQVLAIHRKYMVTPFSRIAELNAYLRFAWEGRQADTAPGVTGPQVLDSATSIQNAINGDTLALATGNFGAAKAPIWVPR